MKNLLKKLAFILMFCCIAGCTKEDYGFYTISGQIIDYTSNVGASNVNLKIKTYKIGASFNLTGGGGSRAIILEQQNIITDQNGNFTLNMSKNNSIAGVSVQSLDDGNFVGRYQDFQIKDFQNIIIAVYKFEILKIVVKNLNPFNSNDKIKFSPPSKYFVKRDNFGVQNETIIDNNGNIQQINEWIGENVNSEITYKVPQYYSGYLDVVKTKNNVSSSITTATLTIVPNQINMIIINY